MARPSNTAERREQIARGFLRVMASRGYEGAALSDAAREAGLAPGLVHYHFQSKVEVLLSSIDLLSRDAEARIERALGAAPADPEAQIGAAVDALLRLGEESDEIAVACWVAIAAEAVRDASVRERYAAAVHLTLSRLERLFGKALAARHDSERGAKAAAAAVYAAVQGYFTLATTVQGAVPRGSAAASVRALAHVLVLRPHA